MSTIPRDKLVTMVDQVNEMHEGWSRAQVEIIRLGRVERDTTARQDRTERRVSVIEDKMERAADPSSYPPPSVPPTLGAILSEFDFEDSPTGIHRNIRIPKHRLSVHVRREMNLVEQERDAGRWNRFVGFFVRNGTKIADKALIILGTAAVLWILHQLGLLGK